MSTIVHVVEMNRRNEDLECDAFRSERYLRRPWKLFKPYLQRSDSLPDLALIPHERPLFTCEDCCFSNKVADLCLWCPLCANAEQRNSPKFEHRRRRVSAPAFMLCYQLCHPRNMDLTFPPTQQPAMTQDLYSVYVNPNLNSKRTSGYLGTKVSANDTNPRPLEIGFSFVEETADIPNGSVLQRQDSKVVNKVGDVVTATSLSQPEPQSSLTSNPSNPLRLVDHLDASYPPSQLCASSDRVDNLDVMNDAPTSSNDPAENISSNRCNNMSTPTLRRRKRHIAMHNSNPPSENAKTWTVPPGRQRPQSQPAASLSAITPSDMRLPITDLHHHMSARAQTQPDMHQLQLGHPNRPYYTALRENMSPPKLALHLVSSSQSAVGLSPGLLSLPRAYSPTFQPPYPASFVDDSHEFSVDEFSQFSPIGSVAMSSPFIPFGIFPLSPSMNVLSSSGKASGFQIPSMKRKFRRHSETTFSKSDEMKLRLALAREVGGADDLGADEGYVYQSRSMANVKMHMRRLSRGFKDLITIKRRS